MNKVHIELKGNQKVFFTSDLHFGHRNICKPTFANRPWEDEKSMGTGLIEKWNSVVTLEDTVFVLGDVFWFNDSKTIKKVLDQLNGKDIYIIQGNHDDVAAYHRVVDPRIHILGDEATLWVGGVVSQKPSKKVEIYLSHCPLLTWPHRANGVPNLFGHIHSGPRVNPENSDADIPLWQGLHYDVGVDNNEYAPIELKEVFKKLNKSL